MEKLIVYEQRWNLLEGKSNFLEYLIGNDGSVVEYNGKDAFVKNTDRRIIFLDIAFGDTMSRGMVQRETNLFG